MCEARSGFDVNSPPDLGSISWRLGCLLFTRVICPRDCDNGLADYGETRRILTSKGSTLLTL